MKKIYFLTILFLIFSCEKDLSGGKISIYNNSQNQKNFIFSVDESYLQENKKNSKPDLDHPEMSFPEAELLRLIMIRDKICINDYSNPSFDITSKQEKIYDITFAGLIEQNYNAKPITPRRYYGKCRDDVEE